MSELYELPSGWEWKRTDEISKLINGRAYKKLELLNEGKYPVLRVGNLFTNNNWYYSDLELPDTKYCEYGDLLYAWSASFGPRIWKGDKSIYHYHIWKIIPYENIVTKKFLFRLLDWDIDQIKSEQGTGTTMMHVTKGSMEARQFPLPPLQEQKRIVLKLDTLFEKIDKSIALHQKNMDKADVFMGSVLNEVFGELNGQYEKRTLESFNKKMSSGGTPSRKEKAYWENGTIDWFSSGELNQLYTLPAKEKITQLGLDKTSTKLFSKGTLLIGMYDTAAMKMSILSTDGSCNQAIVGFKPDENELNIFFTKYQLEYLKKEILEQRQGVRQQNLNLTKIKNIQIEYPPLNIQRKAVAYLDEISQKIEKIKSVQKEKMQSLVALKASILDQAFRGEL